MNHQTIFDKVVRHLGQMPRRAYDVDVGMCMYRAPGGLSCAVGCLITDEEASVYKEGYQSVAFFQGSVAELQDCGLLPERLEGSLDLLDALQTAHDDVNNWFVNDKAKPRAMREMLSSIAAERGLDTAVLDEVFPAEKADV